MGTADTEISFLLLLVVGVFFFFFFFFSFLFNRDSKFVQLLMFSFEALSRSEYSFCMFRLLPGVSVSSLPSVFFHS